MQSAVPTIGPSVKPSTVSTLDRGWVCAVFSTNLHYHIIVQRNGLALGQVVQADTATGQAFVEQSPVSPATNDNWQFLPTTNGFYKVVVEQSGLTLAVDDSAGGVDGSAMIVTNSSSTDGSVDWCFVAAGSSGDGTYVIRNRKSAQSVTVAANSSFAMDRVKVQAFDLIIGGGIDNQKFLIEPINTVLPLFAHSTWGAAGATPLVASTAANLPGGNVLFWGSSSRRSYSQNDDHHNNGLQQTHTGMYDLSTGSITEQLVQTTNHDMYGTGTSSLGNGVLLVSGGGNSTATSLYDFRTDTWATGPPLQISRGFHSQAVLADGRVLTIGGSWSGIPGVEKTGEVWSPATNSWTSLTGVVSDPLETADVLGEYRSDNFYWLFTAPNGKVFHAGPSKNMHWITVSGTGSVASSIQRGDDDDAMNGNAILYDTGKILTVGGSPNYDSGNCSNRAYIIDINSAEATVERTGDMYYRRCFHNSVALPNGEVVVISGQTTSSFSYSSRGGVYQAEIWSPSTGKFQILAPMKVPRGYQSVAVLMKDGRVWASGGANHVTFEILTPPYLHQSNGTLVASRPVINSISTSVVRAGELFTITMNTSDVHTFALVRMSAVTHSTNTDQRRLPLAILSQVGALTTVQLPANTNVVLAGFYYLFAMSSDGVPSVARDVQISL